MSNLMTQEKLDAEIFSLEGLQDWLREQNPKTEYVFMNTKGECLIHRYLIGRGVIAVGEILPEFWAYFRISKLGKRENGTDLGSLVASPLPNTYGAALERLENMMA